ncbi:MAG: hypothetical protein OXG13_05060 [Gemmatimonadaceae bacterium]|nr:hypothetical protein [Gemmatimonadaceae bacterium]
MAVSVIPFQMPEPAAIPEHITGHLRQMPAEAAMRRGMELLMQIEVAHLMLWERVDGEGRLHLQEVLSKEGSPEQIRERLSAEPFYGQPVIEAASGLAGRAFEAGQPLLIMGQQAAGEEPELPPALAAHLLPEGAGNVGFLYVLTLADGDGPPLGALTLVRPASEGPLNHEQPNITEAMRRLLSQILAA